MRNLTMKWAVIGCLMFTACFAVGSRWAIAEESQEQPLDLDGTKWEIDKTRVGKETTSSDTLNFEDKKFYSSDLKKAGYKPTNYSVSLIGAGSTQWGTMQNKEGETAYWEGVVKDREINGTIYIYSQKAKGVQEEYYFKGKLVSGELKQKPKPKPPAVKVKKKSETEPEVKKGSTLKNVEEATKKKTKGGSLTSGNK